MKVNFSFNSELRGGSLFARGRCLWLLFLACLFFFLCRETFVLFFVSHWGLILQIGRLLILADGRLGPQTSERKEMRSVAGQPRKSSCALWLIRGVVCPRSGALLSCRCHRGAGLTEPHQSGENIYDGDVAKGAPECPAVWIIHHLQSTFSACGRTWGWEEGRTGDNRAAVQKACCVPWGEARRSWVSFPPPNHLMSVWFLCVFNWKCHNVELAFKNCCHQTIYIAVLPQKKVNTLIEKIS